MELVRELVAQHYPETAACFRGLDRASQKDTFLRQIQAKANPAQIQYLAAHNRTLELWEILACPHPDIPVPEALCGAIVGGHDRLFDHLLTDPRANLRFEFEDGKTLLKCAIQQGRLRILNRIIHELKYEIGEKEIADAAQYGHLEMVEHLLGDKPVTPAMIDAACEGGRWEVQRSLVRLAPDDVVSTVAFAYWYFFTAVGGGNLDIIDEILNRPGFDPSIRNNLAVREALKAHRPDIILRILQHPLPLRRTFLYQKIWKQLSANDNEDSAPLRDQMINVARFVVA